MSIFLKSTFLALIVFATITISKGENVVVNSAVDLSTAHPNEDASEHRAMEDLLHWAISQSDPEELRKEAEAVQAANMAHDFVEKRKRVMELYKIMQDQPTETSLLKEVILIIRNDTAEEEDVLNALLAMQMLVEPVDNANDLFSLDGIKPLVRRLFGSEEISAAAYHVLGTAASNNPSFQNDLLVVAPQIFSYMLQGITSPHEGTAVKALYALGTMVRNTEEARARFVDAGGLQTMDHVLTLEETPGKLRVKALSLMMDLIEMDSVVAEKSIMRGLPEAILYLLSSPDHSAVEKALLAMIQLCKQTIGQQLFLMQEGEQILARIKTSLQAQSTEEGKDAFIEELIALVEQATLALHAHLEL